MPMLWYPPGTTWAHCLFACFWICLKSALILWPILIILEYNFHLQIKWTTFSTGPFKMYFDKTTMLCCMVNNWKVWQQKRQLPLTPIFPQPDVIGFSPPLAPSLAYELPAACRQSPSILYGHYYLDGWRSTWSFILVGHWGQVGPRWPISVS